MANKNKFRKNQLRMGRLSFYLFLLFLALILAFVPDKGQTNTNGELVYVIPVKDAVEKGLFAFLDRSISEAEENHASLIVLEIHTPGGAVDAATNIGKRIRDSDTPIIAFIHTDALSAGAYIALNTDEIYMTRNGRMGAAAVITGDGNAADDKATSAWLAAMRTAAEHNGRDVNYALAMADKEINLPDVDAPKGKLLTLTAEQALRVGYAEGIADDRTELLTQLGYQDAAVEVMEVSFAEKLARFITHPIVVPILLSIGSLGLVLELYSPGFGIPGIMGASSLVLFFFGHMVAGLAGMETLILFIVGIVLILLEFVVPGGVLGFLGLGAIITSMFLATDDVGHMALSLLISFSITIVVSIILFKVFGKKMRILRKIVLSDSTNTESGYISNVNRVELIGKEGFALTTLRPSGTALINNERVDVVTEGGYIEQNKKVVVIKTEGTRIIVREVVES
ncbi:NfeD family protein [Litchfieldia salsa]|uniref:Membrane-bound serine protease (ClpP class) n=2 Tax=Litchfieldia salsa TaxID=930152 RepID=A0A1H0V9L6_9BACI|nr:nodulation protein NfeD [Litchfieldia salsa]SDP75081.1 membrane-bound serine protease (ClpP class) [Litchfieldia salsa]